MDVHILKSRGVIKNHIFAILYGMLRAVDVPDVIDYLSDPNTGGTEH